MVLREEVVDAVRDGRFHRFHLYAVGTVDVGIELLTGVFAGKVDREGHYPADSSNGPVCSTLAAFMASVRSTLTGVLHRAP